MSYRHLIRFLDDDRSQWMRVDRQGRLVAGPLDGLPDTAADETLVLVPSAEVLLLDAPRVAKQRRQLERAIPFAIEDQLITPVEQCHVVIVEDSRPNVVGVAVVAKTRMSSWLTRLAEGGVIADAMIPEGLLLSADKGSTLLLDDDVATLRWGAAGVMSATPDELKVWLTAILPNTLTQPLTVIGGLPTAFEFADDVDINVLPQSAMAHVVQRAAVWPLNGPTLLSEEFAPKHRKHQGASQWRWAAAVAAMGVVVMLGAMLLERWQLDRYYQTQRDQMVALLKETLPDVQRVVDPRAQMAGELSRRLGQSSDAGVLGMLSKIAPLLSGSGRYTLDGFEYRGSTMEITLRSPDIGTLDELREQISSLGYAAELVAMTPGSAGVEGKLRVRGGGQ